MITFPIVCAFFFSLLAITLVSLAVGFALFKLIDIWERWDR